MNEKDTLKEQPLKDDIIIEDFTELLRELDENQQQKVHNPKGRKSALFYAHFWR